MSQVGGVVTPRTMDAALTANDRQSGRCVAEEENELRHSAIKQPTTDSAARPTPVPITSKATLFCVDQCEPSGKQTTPLAVTRKATSAEQCATARVIATGNCSHHHRSTARACLHSRSSSGDNAWTSLELLTDLEEAVLCKLSILLLSSGLTTLPACFRRPPVDGTLTADRSTGLIRTLILAEACSAFTRLRG